MNTSNGKQTPVVEYGGKPSDSALASLEAHQAAVDKALDRKARLGQYWVEWDGEKPVKVYPENPTDAAAE